MTEARRKEGRNKIRKKKEEGGGGERANYRRVETHITKEEFDMKGRKAQGLECLKATFEHTEAT